MQKGDGSAYVIAQDYAMLGDNELAFQWLEKSIETNDPDLGELMVEPRFETLHSDTRFQDLLRSLNLL